MAKTQAPGHRAREEGPANAFPRQHAWVYPWWIRGVLSTLVLWRWAGVWWISFLVVFASDPPITPPLLVRLGTIWIVLPFVLEASLRRHYLARTTSNGEWVVLDLGWQRLEIPRSRILGLKPWRIPIPGPGIQVVLETEHSLREQIELASPRTWAKAHGLTIRGDSTLVSTTCAFAEARSGEPPWRWYHYGAKFFVFGLVPAFLLFRVHQHIAYGSLWGEYYLRGPVAYLRTWCVYYGTVVTYLILFASLLRSTLEVVLWLLTLVRPAAAKQARRVGERVNQLAYYGGALFLLALRFSGCG